MATTPSPPKGPERIRPFLDGVMETLTLAETSSTVTPAKKVLGSARKLLKTIKDSTVKKQRYVELALSCADVCQALDRGLKGRRSNKLSESMLRAIEELTTIVAKIQSTLHAKSDKDMIEAWRRDLHDILIVFNMELSMNNHMMLLDLYRNTLASQGLATNGRDQSTQARATPGELPPPPPRACFGRDGLIEKVVSLADTFDSVALVGAGGIGKTTIALTVLHDDRIKNWFGDDRRFIRCDQFLPSQASFLNQLSKTIGAGVKNPEDLTPLRPSLSSREMILIIDNAEVILDPEGADGTKIHDVVEELSRFPNISLIVTSRVYIVPPDCQTLTIPTLSMEAACNAFYRIYKPDGRSDPVDDVLKQLDFHPLSVTLLATVARENQWDGNRLVTEWQGRQTEVLRTGHHASLAAAIEVSLSSPMFTKLGPNARPLLEVIAFFPQGVDGDDPDWPLAVPRRNAIFDKFCTLSLTYRNKSFVTMLAPLRDCLRPKDPTQSLLRKIKEIYFNRLSIEVNPRIPRFKPAGWIVSEDVNVEHLLHVFTSIDADSEDVWIACANFFKHLHLEKPRQSMLRSKVEGLPDNHRDKPQCLHWLSWLLGSVGKHEEKKRLSTHALKLNRERGNENEVAETLVSLCDANRMLGFFEEGIEQGREALAIQEGLGNRALQAKRLDYLSHLLLSGQQLDAAKDAVFRTIKLLENDQHFQLCGSHRLLGDIYHSKGERVKAVSHFQEALQIASHFKWRNHLLWIHDSLAKLFCGEGNFDDAHAHIEQAKLHAMHGGDCAYRLGRAAQTHAEIWCHQRRFKEAKSEALYVIEVYEKLGATNDLTIGKTLLRRIEQAAGSRGVRSPLKLKFE